MSLTVYDPEKKCQVLNPEQFTPVINAFHPDYVKTYMPDLLSDLRVAQRAKNSGERMANHVEKTRETKPSHGTMFGLSEKNVSVSPKKMMKLTPAHIHRPKLERTEFHIYNKAGLPKGVKK